MTQLTLRNFSCLKEADLNLSRLTVLIGPQASGKSILSKLTYFFYEGLSRQFVSLEDQRSLENFRSGLSEEFKRWFPPSAWGSGQFDIRFSAGPYEVRVRPAARNKRGSESVRITFSPFFEREYKTLWRHVSQRRRKLHRLDDDPSAEFLTYGLWSAAQRRLRKILGPDYVASQLFIPAGRSFFTSIGKAIAAFEKGGILDPVTVSFGRYFSSLRERRFRRPRIYADDKSDPLRRELIHQFFGGRLRFKRDDEFIEADDGRRIPLGSLSSGQQELLPLLLSLETFRFRPYSICYIEEPEAHLFPSAQSKLVEYLVMPTEWRGERRQKEQQQLFITTHSPYVLTKLNILAKAGILAFKRRGLKGQVAKIIKPESCDRPPVSGPVGMLVERGLLDQRCAGRPSARQRGW